MPRSSSSRARRPAPSSGRRRRPSSAPRRAPFARVIIPTLGLATSRDAEDRGLDIARRYEIPAVALHVLEDAGTSRADDLLIDVEGTVRREAARALQRVAAEARRRGVACQTVLLHGDAAETLIRYAEPDDLVVMSTHARRGLRRILLGSVTEAVVRRAASHVLVVRRGARGP